MAPEWISGLLLITGIYYVQTVTYNNEGSGWSKYNFQLNNTWNDCTGQKWIHLIKDGVNSGKIVGVILCTPPGRYGIFMTDELTKTFVKLGDLWESGEDHCELLGMTDVKNLDPTRVVLGPVLDTDTIAADPNAPKKYPGYYRRLPGDEFQYKVDLEVDSGTGNAWTPKWYECGDIQFVPADEVCGEITCPHTCVVQDGQPVCKCNIGYTQVNGSCTDINECDTNNGGCEDICTNTDGSYFCRCEGKYTHRISTLNTNGKNCDNTCEDGYSITATETSCIDTNECDSQNGGCASGCTNTPGSFFCTCPIGQQLTSNYRSCVAASVGSDGDSSSGVATDVDTGGLLGAVIALAILSALLAIGLLISCIYLCCGGARCCNSSDEESLDDRYSRRRSLRSRSPVSYARSRSPVSYTRSTQSAGPSRFGLMGYNNRGTSYY